jgi:heme A synthase
MQVNSQSMMVMTNVHDSVFLEQKNLLLSFTEGKSGVQFIHRTLAYVVLVCKLSILRVEKSL